MVIVANKICGEYQNTSLGFKIFFKSCALRDNFQKPERRRQATDDNKVWRRKDEICVLDK
jgi:hypothetical protein